MVVSNSWGKSQWGRILFYFFLFECFLIAVQVVGQADCLYSELSDIQVTRGSV